MYKTYFRISAVFILCISLALTACSGKGDDDGGTPLSDAKAINAFSITSPVATGIIDETAKTITVSVPFGTNVTALIAEFTTTGASVRVGGTVQVSGTTPNDFTSPVVYVVTAVNNTSAAYTVTVTVGSVDSKAITAFSIKNLVATGSIDENAKTIAVTVPSGTDVTALIALFSTSGASVRVGSTVQVSGTTPNNFTSPVAYVVTAADGSTTTYTVTVTVMRSATVSHLAGPLGGSGNLNGTGEAARFYRPNSIARDATNLYVADSENNAIRKIVIATGEVTTLAGTNGISGTDDGTGAAALFDYPSGITRVGGDLYVTDTNNHTIRKIVIATGVVSTITGSAGVDGSNDNDVDPNLEVRFRLPYGITNDGTYLYVTDQQNQKIRQIDIAAVPVKVKTIAGQDRIAGYFDGAPGLFSDPAGIICDGTNLYVADSGNHAIRLIDISSLPTGSAVVSTLTGSAGNPGTADGMGAAAQFNKPYGISIDGTNLYVADASNHAIRKIDISSLPTGSAVVSTLTGSAGNPGSADGTPTAAQFYFPKGILVDGPNLYIADTENHTIRSVDISSGMADTYAGQAGSLGFADGTGTAARFASPNDITTDGTNVYVADTNNHVIRKIVISTGVVSLLSGSAGISGARTGPGLTFAMFNEPSGITISGANLYVSDTLNHTIRKIVISSGLVQSFAGIVPDPLLEPDGGYADGTGTSAKFSYPTGITSDGTNLYVADTNNNMIRKILIASQFVSAVTGTFGERGSDDGPASVARFDGPTGITCDGVNLYVADSGNHTIRKIVIATGEVTTIAGSAGMDGSADGTGGAARFYNPYGITTDGTYLYVADSFSDTIRVIVIATGDVTTMAGTAGQTGSMDGPGPSASFNTPSGLCSYGANLYIADTDNHAIRKIGF